MLSRAHAMKKQLVHQTSKSKTSVLQKKPLKCEEINHRLWDKTFANQVSGKAFVSRMYKTLSQLSKKTSDPIQNWAKIHTDTSLKKTGKHPTHTRNAHQGQRCRSEP